MAGIETLSSRRDSNNSLENEATDKGSQENIPKKKVCFNLDSYYVMNKIVVTTCEIHTLFYGTVLYTFVRFSIQTTGANSLNTQKFRIKLFGRWDPM